MLDWLRTRSPTARTATKLYGSIVTQARMHRFYGLFGVPDTPEGRFEMLVLHLALVLERLASERQVGFELGRTLTEAFIRDMDDCMREMGVSDLKVPRRVKKATAALYERRRAYAAALAEPDDSKLIAALGEHVYLVETESNQAGRLARDVRRTEALLREQPGERLLAGDVSFP